MAARALASPTSATPPRVDAPSRTCGCSRVASSSATTYRAIGSATYTSRTTARADSIVVDVDHRFDRGQHRASTPAGEHRDLVVGARPTRGDHGCETIERALAERIGAGHLDRVLRGHEHERLRERPRATVDRDRRLLGRLEQRRLCPRVGAVEFVEHDEVGEDRAGAGRPARSRRPAAPSCRSRHRAAGRVCPGCGGTSRRRRRRAPARAGSCRRRGCLRSGGGRPRTGRPATSRSRLGTTGQHGADRRPRSGRRSQRPRPRRAPVRRQPPPLRFDRCPFRHVHVCIHAARSSGTIVIRLETLRLDDQERCRRSIASPSRSPSRESAVDEQ